MIRETCQQLGVVAPLLQDFDRTLNEMRHRRHVLVHRGGVADEEYCAASGRPEVLGQRLEVDDAYLETADRFVTETVLTLIVRSPQR